jgi:hypothetical protein
MGIDPADPNYNCHHIQNRALGGSDEKDNLFPTPKELHKLFHKEGVNNRDIHNFCDQEYGGDPYQDEERVLYKASKRRQK